MKKTILTLALILIAIISFSQTIQYKQTSITISCDGGFSTTQNDIRYSITADLTDADTLEQVFPSLSSQFTLKDGKLNYASSVILADMWNVIDTVEIEPSDAGKTVKSAIIKWSINLIYQMNLLELNITDWSINE